MTVPGDQPRHLQNYPISTNSNNSTTPLSSELSCRDGNFRWGNNQFFFLVWREPVIITVTPLSGAAGSNDKIHKEKRTGRPTVVARADVTSSKFHLKGSLIDFLMRGGGRGVGG